MTGPQRKRLPAVAIIAIVAAGLVLICVCGFFGSAILAGIWEGITETSTRNEHAPEWIRPPS
ncbi:MAG TPA: hypothetical protein VF062_12135 [Candidatus Limnocylindrales bacterium]